MTFAAALIGVCRTCPRIHATPAEWASGFRIRTKS